MKMGTVTASMGAYFVRNPDDCEPYFLVIKAYISAEMSAFKPVGGGFVRHANMWLDKSTSIAIGFARSLYRLLSVLTHCINRWNFWYSIAITMPTEISAATTLLGFWNPDMNQVIPIRYECTLSPSEILAGH